MLLEMVGSFFKRPLSSWIKILLIVSGLIQSGTLNTHIETIVKMEEQHLGLYLFLFTLITILNILNGANFTSKKSKANLASLIIVTGFQLGFGIMYMLLAINDVRAPQVDLVPSFALFVFSMASSVLACVLALKFYFSKSIMDEFLG